MRPMTRLKKAAFILVTVCVLCNCTIKNQLPPTTTFNATLPVPATIAKGQPPESPTAVKTKTMWPSTLLSSIPIPTVTLTVIPSTYVTSSPASTLLPVMPGRIGFINKQVGYEELNLINTDGAGWTQLPMRGSLFRYAFSWSADGHWIAFDAAFTRDDNIDIYKFNIGTGQLERVTNGPHNKLDVSWSPDGEHLAYVEQNGSPGDIVIVSANGDDIQKITYTSGDEASPAWSPDGQRIAFLYDEGRNPGYEIWIMDADGGNRTPITTNRPASSGLTWSPDGKRLAFTSSRECSDIYVINLDDMNQTNLTEELEVCARSPSWSPDGRHIAFLGSAESYEVYGSRWAGGEQIYLMNADGSGITCLTAGSDWYIFHVAWSPVPAFQIADAYRVTQSGDQLNLRDSPSLEGSILKNLGVGDIVTILEGPVDTEGYYWWRMRTADGIEGWAVEVAGWYEAVTP